MKILVVDDHPLILEAVQNVVHRLGPETVVLSAASCEQGFDIAATNHDLEVVLLDLQLPRLSGIAALKAWRQKFPAVPIVVLSASEERPAVLAAMAAGAAGYIPKSSSNDVMVSALRLVLSGGKYLPQQALSGASERLRRPTVPALGSLGLTPRQLAVLRLIAQGKSNKVICAELGLAERTVKTHISAVFRALKVTSRTQAALAAARLGLASN